VVEKILNLYYIAFFDPDGYFFNREGKDEFGGNYDSQGYYHPGEGNKHEFDSYNSNRGDYEDEDDELIRQYE
jgi:hypothetical protein